MDGTLLGYCVGQITASDSLAGLGLTRAWMIRATVQFIILHIKLVWTHLIDVLVKTSHFLDIFVRKPSLRRKIGVYRILDIAAAGFLGFV